MDNPMDQIRELCDRLKVHNEALFLDMIQVQVIPGQDGTNALAATFIIRPEAFGPPVDRTETDAFEEQFQQMMRDQKIAERNERINEAQKQALDIMNDLEDL